METLRIGEGSRRYELSVPQPNRGWTEPESGYLSDPTQLDSHWETGGSFCLSPCNWLLVTVWFLIGRRWMWRCFSEFLIMRWAQYTHVKSSDMKSVSYPCHKVSLSSFRTDKPWKYFLWSPKERSTLCEGPCVPKLLLSPSKDARGGIKLVHFD